MLNNGHSSKTRGSTFVTNTFATDTILHILTCTVVDDPFFKEVVLGSQNEQFVKFMQIYLKDGAINSTYLARNKLLLKAFNETKVSSLKTLNCKSTVCFAIDKIFKAESFFTTHMCRCSTKVLKLDLNSFGPLMLASFACFDCKVNAEIRSDNITFIDGKDTLMTFNNAPQALLLHDKVYMLLAIVETTFIESESHYFVHIKRTNEKWYTFDSNKSNVSLSDLNQREMTVHVLCYFKINPHSTIKQTVAEPKVINKKRQILRNFHTFNMNEVEISVNNACGPDCLIHALAAIFMEKPDLFSDLHYSEYLMNILDAYVVGDAVKMYRNRIKLLLEKRFCFNGTFMGKATIDCFSNIQRVGEMLGLFSASETRLCTCKKSTKRIKLIEVNLGYVIKKGIDKLGSSIVFSQSKRNAKCSKCKSNQVIETKFSKVIFIDLEPLITADGSMILPKMQLLQIPSTIKLGAKEYILKAAIEHQPSKSHYVVHCRQTNDTWEEYDDLQSNVNVSDSSGEICIHMLIFSI